MSDTDDDTEGDGLWRYGSVLVPLADAWPSSAIAGAVWNPVSQTITISFHRGGTESYPCSVDDWSQYKMSSSRGQAYNSMFRQPSQSQSTPKPATRGINPSPYGKPRF